MSSGGAVPAVRAPGSRRTLGGGSSPTAAGTTTVDLQVLQRGSSTLVLVPVTIAGGGPFPFALDTGASCAAVNSALAQQLGLEPTGGRADVSGVTGRRRCSSSPWRTGRWGTRRCPRDRSLPTRPVGAIDFPTPGGQDGDEGSEIAGLLGFDVLSTFGSITVDHAAEELRFTR